MWHTRIIQVFYVLSKKVGSFCFCSYTSAAAATNVRFHSLYRTRIACKEDGQLPEEKYNYVRYILSLFWIMTNAFYLLICRTGLNFYKAKDGCEMSGRWKRGIFWARTPLFPSSLLLFNNRKRLMLQLDLFSTLLASLSLSLSPSLLLIYVLMILLSAIGCQWERNYNVWSFCSSFVLPLSIHSLDDAGMTDYKQDWKCWCVYYFISWSTWYGSSESVQK